MIKLGKRFDGMRYGHLDHKNINLNMTEANQHLARLINKMSPDVVEKIKRLKLLSSDFSVPEAKEEKVPTALVIKHSSNSGTKFNEPKPMIRSLSASSLLITKDQKIKKAKSFESDYKIKLVGIKIKEKKPKGIVRSRSTLSFFSPKQHKLVSYALIILLLDSE